MKMIKCDFISSLAMIKLNQANRVICTSSIGPKNHAVCQVTHKLLADTPAAMKEYIRREWLDTIPAFRVRKNNNPYDPRAILKGNKLKTCPRQDAPANTDPAIRFICERLSFSAIGVVHRAPLLKKIRCILRIVLAAALGNLIQLFIAS